MKKITHKEILSSVIKNDDKIEKIQISLRGINKIESTTGDNLPETFKSISELKKYLNRKTFFRFQTI